jgi:hypothetical protein
MKTLKLALVATLVAFAMANVASADGFKGKPAPVRVINLTLEKAMQYPGLATAMYTQINPKAFLNNPSLIYIVEVTYNGILFRISGSREEWIRFFNLQGIVPITTKDKPVGIN